VRGNDDEWSVDFFIELLRQDTDLIDFFIRSGAIVKGSIKEGYVRK
jgi:hypothetical protein